MLRRGAATDLMEQVGDALAAPRVASVADERPPCLWIEKGVRTKKADQSGQGCESGSTMYHSAITHYGSAPDHTRSKAVNRVGDHTLE